jgi:hypothetical protein
MTLSTFRRSRKTRRNKSRGGNGLYNAAAASLLPLGLLVAQQYYKNRSNRKYNGVKSYKKRRNTKLEDPYDNPRR